MNTESHEKLLMIFNAGLDRVRGESAVSNFIAKKEFTKQYQLISIGKAACSMALGALSSMQDNINETLVITKKGHIDSRLSKFQQVTCIESDHPIPSTLSIQAGKSLIEFINSSPNDHEFMFLISGGASSLVEVLSDGVDLSLLQKLTDEMLASGLNIAEMNMIRRSISKIKGGRLLHYLKGKIVYSLLISDVPNDDPAVIGSGLLARVEDKKFPKNLPEQILNNPNEICTIGLVCDPARLSDVRRNRIHSINEDRPGDYIDEKKITGELNRSKEIFKKYNWPVIDVTRKSVEETAASIIKTLDILNSR